MHEQWDAAFLLDVIEHLPDDLQALRQNCPLVIGYASRG